METIHGVVVGIAYSLLFLTSLVGNIFMIVAVCLSMKLRTITNAFVVALSIIDIAKAANLIPRMLNNFGHRSDTFVQSCKVSLPVALVLLMASGILITLIAINRYVLVTKHSHTFKRVFPKRAVCAMVIASFASPLALILLLMYFGNISTDAHCRVYTTPLFNYILGCFLLMLVIVISVCYVNIFIFVRRHFRQVHHGNYAQRTNATVATERTERSGTAKEGTDDAHRGNDAQYKNASAAVEPSGDASRSGVSAEGTDDSRAGERALVHRRDKLNLESQITKNMILAVCVFVFCFSPLAFYIMLSHEHGALLKYFATLAAVSGSLNPLLFGWKHPVFRHVFGCMLRRSLAEIEEPSPCLRRYLRKT